MMNALIPAPADLESVIELLGDAGALLTVDSRSGVRLVPAGDLSDLRSLQLAIVPEDSGTMPLFDVEEHDFSPALVLAGGAHLLRGPQPSRDSRTGAHIRAVLSGASALGAGDTLGDRVIGLYGGWELRAASEPLAESARVVRERLRSWEYRIERDFASSASYMGSKRPLLPFLMQGLQAWLPRDTVFVDLMCGSGSVSGAASRLWRTVASDAQQFCTTLAGVQSGGYSSRRAEVVLEQLQTPMQANVEQLAEHVQHLLAAEEHLFHSPLGIESAAAEYRSFIEKLPSYPKGGRSEKWDPLREILNRQNCDRLSSPWCLFTAYYSDLYLGIRQAVEVDSLRYAISTLTDPVDKRWALGALVVAMSKVATSYGGHFAQPRATPKQLSDARLFTRVVAQRSLSVTLEFEKRLISLARESESVDHAVEVVDGPWNSALERLDKMLGDVDVTVYVDAPYRREEYSRYYHLLETLVRYDYPIVSLPARVPDKRLQQRFASEFFTRNRVRMTEALANVLRSVLDRGWRCAWSYADNADARVEDVISLVASKIGIMHGIAADHTYSWQGSHERPEKGPRLIRELLMLMEP
jgi:adenine-specific DNA-methyltransferase